MPCREDCPCVNYCDGSMIEACMDDWRKRKQEDIISKLATLAKDDSDRWAVRNQNEIVR